MYNLRTPLAHIGLSKHYTTKTTTMYRSLYIDQGERELNNIFRPDTEINGNNWLSYRYIDGNPANILYRTQAIYYFLNKYS